MDGPSLIDPLHAFEEGISSINAIRYCALAAALIIFWDHVSTFDREVEFLRFRRLSIGKVLFIVNRYYTLAAAIFNNYGLFTPNVSNSVCNHLFRWQAATGIISVLISQTTLLLRLYALYDLDKRVLALMVTLFVGTLGSAAAIHILAFSKIRASSHDLPGMPFCVPHGLPPTYWVVWVPILAFETFLLALAIRRAMLQDRFDNPQAHMGRKSRSRRERIRDPWAKTQRFATLISRAERLVDVLIRDSVLYFFVMFAAYLVNLLVWLLGTVNTLDLPIAFSEAFSCVMCSHMLLNVHELSRKDAAPTDNSSHPVFHGQSIALRETSYGVEVSVHVESGMA